MSTFTLCIIVDTCILSSTTPGDVSDLNIAYLLRISKLDRVVSVYIYIYIYIHIGMHAVFYSPGVKVSATQKPLGPRAG